MIVDSPSYDIRYSRILDKSALIKWVSTPSVLRWFPVEEKSEQDLFLNNWIGFSRYKASITATYDHKAIGIATLYLMPYKKVHHLSMFNVVVDPAYHGQGVGTSLVRNLVHLGKTQFHLTSLHAEIMGGNPLISILEKQGFYEVFSQDDYYKLSDGTRVPRVVMEVIT